MLWILTGILLVLCVRNHFDVQGVARDVRGMARTARKMVREVAKALRRAASDAKKEKETVPIKVDGSSFKLIQKRTPLFCCAILYSTSNSLRWVTVV